VARRDARVAEAQRRRTRETVLGEHLREVRLSLLDDPSVGLDQNIADRRRVSRELRRAVLPSVRLRLGG
jgi:hypothetical protein